MSFSTHTFEINPEGNNLSFAFHENLGEGRDIYFLGRFPAESSEAQGVAESIFGEIVDTFKQKEVFDAYDTFEEGLKAANLEAKKNKPRLPKAPDVVIAYFDFHNLFLTQSGEAEAYLLRGDTVSQISEPGDGSDDLFNNILSGQVSIDDTVVFASSRILRVITTKQFSDILSRTDFDDACSILRHELANNSEEDLLVNVIGVGKKSSAGGTGFLSKMVSKISGEEKNKIEAPIVKEASVEIDEPRVVEDLPAAPALDEPSEFFTEDRTDFETVPTEKSFNIAASSAKITDKAGDLLKNVKGRWSGIPNQHKKNIIKIGIAFVLLILVGRFLTNFESQDTKEIRAELQIARESLQQADTFLLQGDRDQAAELLSRSQVSAQKILNAKSKDFRFDAQTLLADIQEKQLAVENARQVSPQLLADLGVKTDNLSATGLLGLKGSLYAYDSKNVFKTIRNIVETGLQISTKESTVAATTRADQNTLLFLTDGPRIIESKNGVITPMVTTDQTWKSGVDIKTFGRFAYVLDPLENQIWKYERRRANYSGATAYSQGADLSRAISIAIDGSIYILSDDGSLQKLFRGVKAEYGFRDLPSIPFGSKNIRLFTSPDLDFIYVLDPDNSRILVFTKGDRFATYKKQVIFDSISDVRDFVIDDTGQKANIITSDKIYELSL